jgi:hypothetical protein
VPEITITSQVPNGDGLNTAVATVTVTHFDAAIGEVSLQYEESRTIGTTTSSAIHVTANVNGKAETSGSFGVAESAFTMIVSTNADSSLQLTKEPATAADTITLSNKCSFPVQFLFTPGDSATQTFMVAAGEELPISIAAQWKASGKVSSLNTGGWFGTLQSSPPSYDLAAVGFNNANAVLTVVEGDDNYEIVVSG